MKAFLLLHNCEAGAEGADNTMCKGEGRWGNVSFTSWPEYSNIPVALDEETGKQSSSQGEKEGRDFPPTQHGKKQLLACDLPKRYFTQCAPLLTVAFFFPLTPDLDRWSNVST